MKSGSDVDNLASASYEKSCIPLTSNEGSKFGNHSLVESDNFKSTVNRIHTESPLRKNEVENEVFDWDDYLKSTVSVPAPHQYFKHVEVGLFNGFTPGMKLEVANKENPNTFWVATLISTCGSLLLLRFDGSGDDRKYDFWADLVSADLHPIGWCAQTGKTLQPPSHIKDKIERWVDFLVDNLVGARSAPARFLEGPHRGKTLIEMIECGMILEVQDSQHPQHVWVAEVVKNVGGRLLLRYKGLQENDFEHDFWLFFLDQRIHNFGWGKSCGLLMRPPDTISYKYSTKEEWARVLTASLFGVNETGLVPECVFKDQLRFRRHSVKKFWKIAILDPVNRSKICPATIVKIIDDYFFLAQLDGVSRNTTSYTMVCHSDSPYIFSVDWCVKHNIPVELAGSRGDTFDWDHYLRITNSIAAPSICFPQCEEAHGFETGMKLEACNPFNLNEISVATIDKIYGGILQLELTSSHHESVKCYHQSSSMDIFPVGWCQSNDYPLSTPNYTTTECVSDSPMPEDSEMMDIDMSETTDEVEAIRNLINPSSDSELWCPILCFNCICKSGPFLNDCDLSRIPKYVGPGNTVLVLKEVLTLLVKAAERPHKLLKDLEDFTVCHWNHPCIIKTKFSGKKYQGTLHIVNDARDVEQFTKALLEFLRCCPCLITIGHPVKECTHNCVSARPVGRPPLKKLNRKIPDKKSSQSIPPLAMATNSTSDRSSMILNEVEHVKKHKQLVSRPGSGEKGQVSKLTDPSFKCSSPSTIQTVYENLDKKKRSAGIKKLPLHTNPLHWTTGEVVEFIESTECAQWSSRFATQQVDGQALLLLTLPVIQQFLGLKLGAALKVARQVERVKISFYEKFCS